MLSIFRDTRQSENLTHLKKTMVWLSLDVAAPSASPSPLAFLFKLCFMTCCSSGLGAWYCVAGTLDRLDSLTGPIDSCSFSAFLFRCTMEAFGVLTAFGGDIGFFSGGEAGAAAAAAGAGLAAGAGAASAGFAGAGGGVVFVAAFVGFSSSCGRGNTVYWQVFKYRVMLLRLHLFGIVSRIMIPYLGFRRFGRG